ncbi:MAG: hypothetical protein DMG61_08495 [Acidobacteria bacterium]|nr:MAG: hypothetical protein DMG61_08495 [Acidobacteriota bacterium]
MPGVQPSGPWLFGTEAPINIQFKEQWCNIVALALSWIGQHSRTQFHAKPVTSVPNRSGEV